MRRWVLAALVLVLVAAPARADETIVIAPPFEHVDQAVHVSRDCGGQGDCLVEPPGEPAVSVDGEAEAGTLTTSVTIQGPAGIGSCQDCTQIDPSAPWYHVLGVPREWRVETYSSLRTTLLTGEQASSADITATIEVDLRVAAADRVASFSVTLAGPTDGAQYHVGASPLEAVVAREDIRTITLSIREWLPHEGIPLGISLNSHVLSSSYATAAGSIKVTSLYATLGSI